MPILDAGIIAIVSIVLSLMVYYFARGRKAPPLPRSTASDQPADDHLRVRARVEIDRVNREAANRLIADLREYRKRS